MAERQETSVMASIQDILRDAQSREEEEKIEAEWRAREDEQQRLDDIRRKQEQEQARLHADEEERQRRAFEEKRRHAEIQAVQEGAIQRARLEAESQARLAEQSSRQEHERQLHALKHDKSRKGLQMGLAGAGVLLLALAVGGGVWITWAIEDANSAKAELHALEAQKEQAEADKRRLENDLANAPDKASAAAAQMALADANRRLAEIQNRETAKKPATGGGPVAAPKPNPGSTPKPACTCQAGDPLCSCL
jgi:membrane protein involved in colicin uptake